MVGGMSLRSSSRSWTFFETEVWKTLFEFQKDGTKGAINKILKHNGCIVADSVGLGKTYEALAVIKYFELKNERVLVLCPKKLSDNWTVYFNAKNLTNQPLRYYEGYVDRPIQREFYDITVEGGVRVHF